MTSGAVLSRAAAVLVLAILPGCAGPSPGSGPAGGAAPSPGGPPSGGVVEGGAPGPTGEGGSGAAPLPCAVDAVLAGHCRSCHGSSPSFGAPMPLVTFGDLHAPAVSDRTKPVYALVEERIHDAARPMPQPPNPRLDAADLATLDAWVAAGAPAGAACDGGAPSADGGAPSLSCAPDTHVAPASPWSMPASESEAYVCYGFDVSVGAKRHITAMAPRLDDASLLHHIVLLEADASVSPVPAECPLGGSTSWRPVFGWAPGGGSFELPPQAGFPEDTTTHFVVQLHYVNLDNAPGHSDASGFDLCTTGELRPNDADVMAFGTTNIAIPPLATLTDSCAVEVPWWGASTHLFAAFPHMHTLGDAIATTAVPGDGGAPANLGSVPSWSFGEQGWIPISYDLVPGDTVETSCTWTNTTDEEVSFGELSTNEMCYSFTMYYPKITNAAWSWAYPALYSVCSAR